MMTFLKIKKTMLPLAVLFFGLPSFLFGQQINVNQLFYFGGQDKICFTYPDSNCIYALGEEHVQDSVTKIFTAAFDYNGNLLWKKDIGISPSLRPSVKDGFKNLIKLSPGLYVAGGNLNHYPLSGNDRGAVPFLYFFDAHGDSLNFVTLEDTAAARWLTALHKISDNRFMAAGTDSILHYNGPLGPYDDTTVSAWVLRLNDTGQINLYKKINLRHITYIARMRPRISGIHTVSGDSVRYLMNTIIANGSPGDPVRINIETDADFRQLGAYVLDVPDGYLTPDGFHIIDHPTEFGSFLTFSSTPENSLMPGSYFYIGSCMIWKQGYFDAVNFDAAFLCRFDLPPIEPPLGYNTYPCPGFGLSSATWLKPLGLGLSDTTGSLGHVFFMFRSIEQNFHYNHLIQAPNGDLLALKEGNLPSDSTNTPLYYYEIPIFFRADSSDGHIRWSMPVQYKPTIDTTVEEHLYDMEIAPNGQIVLAGFVNVHTPTSGYDSTGQNSWLVILDDSVHDHHADGIVLLSEGQQANILVYPNPAINYTTIDLQNFKGNIDEIDYQICDLAGKILQNRQIKNTKTTININGYTPGIYFITFRYQGRPMGAVKLIKSKT